MTTKKILYKSVMDRVNELVKIQLRKGDIDRIIMALEEWGEGEDLIEELEKYASEYMGGKNDN